MGVFKVKILYVLICWLFFFNSFVYAEDFLNTTRGTLTGDLKEAVKVGWIVSLRFNLEESYLLKNCE